MGGRAERGHRAVPRDAAAARALHATRLTELWNYPRVGVPVDRRRPLFYSRNTGLQRQSPVYMRAEPRRAAGAGARPERHLSPDGSVSLAQWAPSPDAQAARLRRCRKAAPTGRPSRSAMSRPGRTGGRRALDALLGPVVDEGQQGLLLLALSGAAEGQGARSGARPARRSTTTASARRSREDVLIYERKDLPAWIINGTVTEDGRYLFILCSRASDNNNRLYYADLGDPTAPNVDARDQAARRERRCGVRADSATTARRALPAHRQGRAEPPGDRDRPRASRRRSAWKTVVAGAASRRSRPSRSSAAASSRSISSTCRAG